MKNLFLATVFAASLAAFGLPSEAEAKVVVYFGVPHYSYQPGPDYYYRGGYGWYMPNDYYYPDHYSYRSGFYGRARLSCGEAKWRVRERGFRNVSTIECDGRTYTFKARRGDHRVIVYVNSRTGAIWRG
jgi:hypothetical protein